MITSSMTRLLHFSIRGVLIKIVFPGMIVVVRQKSSFYPEMLLFSIYGLSSCLMYKNTFLDFEAFLKVSQTSLGVCLGLDEMLFLIC